MPEFPHLPFRGAVDGLFNFPNTPRKDNPTTIAHLKDRKRHSAELNNQVNAIEAIHWQAITQRKEEGLPDLPFDNNVSPVFLEVDPSKFDIEALQGFGIDVISEEGDGYILGASIGFQSLRDRIDAFLKEKNKNTAQLWQIVDGIQWRVEHILSQGLFERWQHNKIDDADSFTVEIGVACYLKMPPMPAMKPEWDEVRKERAVTRWQKRNRKSLEKKDELNWQRQDEIQGFIELYGGAIVSEFIEFDDSFCFQAQISGKALKDIVRNYPYVFEVIECSEIDDDIPIQFDEDVREHFQLIPPPPDSPTVCVIDSGIMEGHRLLSPAIKSSKSKSYVPYQHSQTADLVPNGGHGTRVAGAVLYGNDIPRAGSYQLPCFLYNARVLDENKSLSSLLFPPELMESITDDFVDAVVYNISINNRVPCRTVRMSQWASKLDKLSHQGGHLFVISAGNLRHESRYPNNPGIKEHLRAGRSYPHYLLESASRIADPAPSAFSLTVGAVCVDRYEDEDLESFGHRDEISSFSRSGWGMWGAIKPEVVEYGGDWVREKIGDNLMYKGNTCPETVTVGGGSARSDIGTSFAAPKVSHIAAHLAATFPENTPLFHKALIIQSARLPNSITNTLNADHIRHYGYGIPSLERALKNDAQRITFTVSGQITPSKTNLYTVAVPSEIRRQGDDYEILIEVSLCYTAEPRRTRRKIGSYLSTWLTWQSAPLNQSFAAFKAEVLANIDSGKMDDESEISGGNKHVPWTINERSNWGVVKGINRQSSANQKDWAVIKSYDLPGELSFAVVGHKGWEKDLMQEIPYAFVVSFEVLNAEIPLYELMARVNVEVEQESQVALL